MKATTLTRYCLMAYLVLLATVFDVFTIENINLLFLAVSLIALVVLIAINYQKLPISNDYFVLLIYAYMLTVNLINFETTRWSSVVYSGFFIISFVFFEPHFRHYLNREQIRSMLRVIFYLYFVGLIAGQLHVYFNLFSGVSGVMGFMRGGFGTIMEKDGMRYFSLSSEPSYAAFIVIVTFYVYLKLDSQKSTLLKGSNLMMLLILVYMLAVFKSAYGIVLLGLMLLLQLRFSWTAALLTIAITFTGVLMLSVVGVDIKPLNRVQNIIQNIDLTNLHSLYSIDFTAYYRIAPVLHYIDAADLTNLHFLLGEGAGASRFYAVAEIYGGYMGGEFLGGFLPAFFIDYGLVGGCLVFLFLATRLTSFFSFPTAVILLMLLNANFNTQLFWLIVLCFSLLRFYEHPVKASHSEISGIIQTA